MRRAAVCPRPGCPSLRPCPTHDGNHTGWSSNRNRAAQARFRQAVLARDDHTCQDCGLYDPTGKGLRATHIKPLAEDGTYDLSNGATKCADCDRATDPYAR